jgi:PhnB protein
MANLYPYFYCDDARMQADFYVKALNAEVISVQLFDQMPDVPEELKGKVMHLTLQACGHTFFMAEGGKDAIQNGNQLDLTLEFATEQEARAAFEGLSDGGQVLMPFEKMFWGAMFGRIVDPFGVRWQIATES